MIPPIRCDLAIQEVHDNLLRRHVRFARLLDLATNDPLTIPRSLYDLTVIAVNGSSMTLIGLERTSDDFGERNHYAQSWLLTSRVTALDGCSPGYRQIVRRIGYGFDKAV